jgi:serine/threonine protein kinase
VTDLLSRVTEVLSGRYQVERVLGEGGMATVFLAKDLKHNREVAIKVLRADISRTVGGDRFLREIEMAAKLTHPHILPLFDSGDVDGLLFYVMPNVEGNSLRDKLNASKQLAVDEAVRIGQEVAKALDYAHRHGVVHRDIKPENIMLHEGGALVADFGIGKAVGAVEADTFTATGATVGTPAYMSPEQAAGESVDGRSDIYSLGCMLYEMLTGEQPFTGPTVQAVIAKRFVQDPADITALRTSVPRPIARAVQKALARTPIDRFETGQLLATALGVTEDKPEKAAAPEKSIAVLPFANMSTDPENEFFADGITEEILNSLAQIPELKVAGRTSSFSYKGKNQDLRIIGEQLGVRTVLEGSVRRAGKRVRITAQLIDVTDGYHLWSDKYDREIEDVFAVQDEIAGTIAAKMKTTLKLDSAAQAQRATENIEAYEAYLKGRALLYRRGQSISLGLAQMERALALDPEYALAWSGIADTYSLLGYYGIVDPRTALSKARAAADKALKFGPDLAESHTSSALVSLLFEWQWVAAERSFKKALELNPGYAQGVAWYYLFNLGFAEGRWEDAANGVLALWERDSKSGYLAAVIAIGYAGPTSIRDPRALEWAERAVHLDPTAFLSKWALQLALQAVRDLPRAIEVGEQLRATEQALPLQVLALCYFMAGDRAKCERIYADMIELSKTTHVGPITLAMVGAALGREDVATHVAQARETRDPGAVIFGLGWQGTEALRAHPAMQALLAEIRLPGWKPGAEGYPE